MLKVLKQLGALLFALALALSPVLAQASQVGQVGQAKTPVDHRDAGADKPAKTVKDFVGNADPNELVDIVIEMEGRPVAELYTETRLNSGPLAAEREDYQVAHATQLKQEQAPVVAAANLVGKVQSQMTVLLNGVSVTGVARRDIGSLAAMPGVKEVYVVPNAELDLKKSVPFIGASRSANRWGLMGATPVSPS